MSIYLNKVVLLLPKPLQILHKGDVLFKIEPRPFQAKVDQFEASLELVQLNLKRAKKLFAKKVGSAFDVDKLEYLLTENGQSHINFVEKPGYTGETEIHLIAEYITRAGNKKYITGEIILPSVNLKY